MATKTNRERALADYKTHLSEISTLLLNAMNRVDELGEAARLGEINWASVGDMTRARESAVTTAWMLGAISIEEAKAKHGVIL